MRSYREMVDAGDWPPTNREAILFLIGCVLGVAIGYGLGSVLSSL